MFDKLVQDELEKVRKKIRPFNSWEEVYGILLEEIHEFQEEVFKKAKNRDKDNTLKELYQIAGICSRAEVDLVTDKPTPIYFPDNEYNSHAESLGTIKRVLYNITKELFETGSTRSKLSYYLQYMYKVCKDSAISLGLVES